MKKILFISGILILLFLLSIYLFIPGTISIQRRIHIGASDANSLKYISSSAGWEKWWPEKNSIQKKDNKNTEFCYQSFCYQLLKTTNTGAEVQVISKDIKTTSQLSYFPISQDSLEVIWRTDLQNSSPIERIMNYQKALKISKNMDEILRQMKTFFDNERLVYGIDIKRDVVKHMLLLTTEKTSSVYPDVHFVSNMVADLRSNIKKQAATETASPMLNVYQPNQKNYVITVAIPINKEISSSKTIYIKKMVEGKLLVSQVHGGPQTIKNAFSSFHQYMKDKRLGSPAMPYEMMITDRSVVRDTSKWVTQIYYPVY